MPAAVIRYAWAAIALAVAALFTARVLKAFTLSETLSVLACLAGAAVLVRMPGPGRWRGLDAPRRLVAAGGFIGLAGLGVKGAFVLLGIGAAGHDPVTHEVTAGNPLLVHIHHLFFNAGFLPMLVAGAWLLARRVRGA